MIIVTVALETIVGVLLLAYIWFVLWMNKS